MRKLLEKTHNTWFNTEDKALPLWNVIVVNHVHVLFVFHHSIADGVGGTGFHIALLRAWNSVSNSPITSASSIVQVPNNDLPEDNITIFTSQNRKASIPRIVLSCFYLVTLRFLLPSKHWFFSSTKYSMAVPPATSHGKAENRAVTRVQSLRLDHFVLSKCLANCKKNNTTFTSLTATLIAITLAADIYPDSKLSILATQVNCRRYAEQEENIMNLASTISQTSFVSQYRKAGLSPLSTTGSESPPLIRKKVMDCPLFWTLARKYNTWLKDGVSERNGKTPIPVQDFMAMSSFRKGRGVCEADFAVDWLDD